jgi:hypothetical protein
VCRYSHTWTAIPPDFRALRSHKCINNIRSSSNKFPLGTPLYFNSRKLQNPLNLLVQDIALSFHRRRQPVAIP